MNIRMVVAAATLATLVAGCATPFQKQVRDDAVLASQQVTPARENLASRGDATFEMHEHVIYLGSGKGVAVVVDDGREAVLESYTSLQHGYRMTLSQIAEKLQIQGIRTVVTADAIAAAVAVAAEPMDDGGEVAAGAAASAGGIRVDYAGSVRGLLDEVTARTGTYWEWTDDGIVIARVATRTYSISAIPGSTGTRGRMGITAGGTGGAGGGGDGGGAGGTASQETSMESEIDVIGPVAEAIASMLSESGKIAVAPGIGLLTVTDVPAVHGRVREFVERVNHLVTRQAVVEVQVVTVDLTDAESLGLDWNLVRSSMVSGNQLDLLSLSDASVGASSASYAIFDPGSTLAGSSVLLHALRSQGHVTVQSDARVPTLSHTPTAINVSDETSYLARVESSIVPGALGTGASVQVSLTPDTVKTGFFMQMLPVILDNDEVLLDFSTSVSALRELRTVAGGSGAESARIEVPSVSERGTMQRVKLRSGQTLALWGFEQQRTRDDARGVGSASFFGAGGGRNSTRTRTVIVILVTPKVLG